MRPSTGGRFNIEPVLHNLGNGRRIRFFRRKQIIFSEGSPNDSIFYIQKGSVKLTVTSRHGKEAIIEILDGGNFFGESALDQSRPLRTFQATALTDVLAVRIEPATMLRLIHAHEDVCDVVLWSLIALTARIIENYADSLLYSSEERLARALAAIARVYEDSQRRPVPKISQQDLASMIGVTRQRVNILMKHFRNLGFTPGKE